VSLNKSSQKVAKVLFDSNVKATGIQFLNSTSGGTIYTAHVNKEVLLAAGTLQTPAILERSGIGGSPTLSKFNIKQLVDLPGVGLNLHDQPGTSLSALVNFANTTNTLLEDVIFPFFLFIPFDRDLIFPFFLIGRQYLRARHWACGYESTLWQQYVRIESSVYISS
jgi:choline dehydrogenase-like flavoprotein